jgi:hypothetical protein
MTTDASTVTTTDDGTTTTTTATTTDTGTQTPTWMEGLPDELKGDKTLSRYSDLETFARGHLETKRLASSKVIVPGDDASEDDRAAFYNAIGRPENADDYEIKTVELPVDASDEERAALAEATKPFKEFAHKLGLTAAQATALSEFDLQRSADFYAKGQEEVGALKTRLGKDYDTKLAAAQKAFLQIFPGELGEKFATELDRKVGSGAMLEGFMRLSEIMGEHQLIDSDTVEGFGDVADAEGKLAELEKDKSWREKLKAGDQTVVNQQKRLLDLAKRQALRGRASQ